MAPPHGHFTYLQPLACGNKQDLGVEPEAVGCLLLEDRSHALPFEKFEPALRIPKIQAKDNPHHHVEETAARLANSRLMPLDEGAIQAARTNDDIGLFCDRDIEQLLEFLDRC